MNLEIYRPFIFFSVLTFFLILELRYKKRTQKYHKRLVHNLFLIAISSVVLKLAFPFGLATLATKFYGNAFGLHLANMPLIVDLLITVFIFDLAIYFQHRLFHRIPWLWKSHLIHHSDETMDFSTALRFHPVEILISAVYKILLIFLLQPRIETYLMYEVLLSSFAIYNHSNISHAKKWDSFLRYIIVTPNMHTNHHHPNKELTNSNYGNIFSLWDRLFKTYTKDQAEVFGIDKPKIHKMSDLLFYPFK